MARATCIGKAGVVQTGSRSNTRHNPLAVIGRSTKVAGDAAHSLRFKKTPNLVPYDLDVIWRRVPARRLERIVGGKIGRRNLTLQSPSRSAEASAWGPEETLVRAFIDEAWNQGDFRNLSTQLAPVVTLHFGGRDIPLRIEDMIALVERFRNAFADFRWTVDEAVAQGRTVAMRTTFSGAMTGPFDGHPPTGRSMKVPFQLFGHVQGGRLCELWEEYDVAGMRRQLGIEP